MAVSVEDRDQKYSFVDVRDVVVLDPEVRCYASCLLRGAVDALQQSGWEFSVQVKPSMGQVKLSATFRFSWRLALVLYSSDVVVGGANGLRSCTTNGHKQ